MWEAIAAAIGLVATVASYFIWNRKRRRTARDILDQIEREREKRNELYKKGLKELSNHDYKRNRDVSLLLKANKRNPK